MIRYTRSIVPPVLPKKVTNTDRLSLRISYTLRLQPKIQPLPLPIDRDDEAENLENHDRMATPSDWY